MRLSRLTEEGISAFREFLVSQASEEPQVWSNIPLENPIYSTPVLPRTNFEGREFKTRFALAQHVYEKLAPLEIEGIDRDAALWAWIAWRYFGELCPEKERRFHPGDEARWIPAVTNFRRYYRHLVAGPFQVYRANRDNPKRALAVLAGPPDKPGDLVEQLASRQELITNKCVLQVATQLYIDPSTQSPRKGSGGRGPGSPRRLANVLNQFDVTYDLYAMDASALAAMLPSEFNKFKKQL